MAQGKKDYCVIMVAHKEEKPSRLSVARGKTMRAFRALRALRPKAALRLLPKIRTFRTIRDMDFARVIRRLTKSDGSKRAIVKRVFKATLSAAASFSLIPISYALSAVWPEGMATASPLAQQALGIAPANAISRWFGKFAQSSRIPYFFHQQLIRMLIRTYNIDVSEVELPLTSYNTLQEFFSRRLKPCSRPPHPRCPLVSPCDAELLQCGIMSDDNMIFQVKGDAYGTEGLLQTTRKLEPLRQGFERVFFLFHLRPRDYHRFHSPADMEVLEAVHVPGTLHPVTYTSAKWIPGLFAKNERVSLMTRWQHGQLAFVPVGATCVGSISLGFDDRIRTNRTSSVQNIRSLFRFASGACEEGSGPDPHSPITPPPSPASDADVFAAPEVTRFEYESSGGPTPSLEKGSELGWFNWGSAIVLIADVPEGCGVRVKPLQDVRVGDPLISW